MRHALVYMQQPIMVNLNPFWEHIKPLPGLQRCLWHHCLLPPLPHHPLPFRAPASWPPLSLSHMGKFPTSHWSPSVPADLSWVNNLPLSLRKPGFRVWFYLLFFWLTLSSADLSPEMASLMTFIWRTSLPTKSWVLPTFLLAQSPPGIALCV